MAGILLSVYNEGVHKDVFLEGTYLDKRINIPLNTVGCIPGTWLGQPVTFGTNKHEE